MSSPLDDAQAFLMGGGGAAGAFTKNDGVGVRRGGEIVDQPEVRQQTDYKTGDLLYWKDGSPRKHLVVTVQTDQRDPEDPEDEGRRRFYVKANLQKAVRDAVKLAGANGLQVGGQLYVTRTGQEPPKVRGEDGAWMYSAEYVPASTGFLNDGAPAQPAAQAQPAQQAPSTQPAGNGNGNGGMDPALAAALSNLSPEERAALLGANK